MSIIGKKGPDWKDTGVWDIGEGSLGNRVGQGRPECLVCPPSDNTYL
jgi:hypothetical protein